MQNPYARLDFIDMLATFAAAMHCSYLTVIKIKFAYLVSFLFNYAASTRYTFRVRSTARRGAGFTLAHIVNFLLQSLLLALFLRLGLSKPVAMLPVFAICVPVNFLLVRYFLKSKTSEHHGNQNT